MHLKAEAQYRMPRVTGVTQVSPGLPDLTPGHSAAVEEESRVHLPQLQKETNFRRPCWMAPSSLCSSYRSKSCVLYQCPLIQSLIATPWSAIVCGWGEWSLWT